ncbi:TOTE conflict system archaeo-eukaryotic primase domain-containing protein [Evansella tamaricis]|uniref:TOTE conflict system primase domain-containing protein n=1 Tax=Evansella tamaricis TaxID=2069301 RepID=A0ABS6JDU0_9BACI|nr:hypothetical protein [Evansella tamaricis]MBU9711369.1 hypothetical protein [Evansella tamaricis]
MLKQQDHILQQINTLIIGERHKFIEQTGRGTSASYITIPSTLHDQAVRQHIEGDRTIGCFYCGKGSKFLCFDIDDKEPIKTLGIISTLKRIGFPKEHIHVEDSGNKGYHVWLFFDDTLPIEKLVSFGKWVISQLGEYQDGVEL